MTYKANKHDIFIECIYLQRHFCKRRGKVLVTSMRRIIFLRYEQFVLRLYVCMHIYYTGRSQPRSISLVFTQSLYLVRMLEDSEFCRYVFSEFFRVNCSTGRRSVCARILLDLSADRSHMISYFTTTTTKPRVYFYEWSGLRETVSRLNGRGHQELFLGVSHLDRW